LALPPIVAGARQDYESVTGRTVGVQVASRLVRRRRRLRWTGMAGHSVARSRSRLLQLQDLPSV